MNMLLLLWLILGTFLGIVIIILIGYTILHFLPKNNDFPSLQRLAISYGLGTGFLALSMFISILIGLHSRVSFVPLLIIILFLFLYFKIYRDLSKDIKTVFKLIKQVKFNIIEYFCIFLIIIELFLIFSYWFIYPIHTGDAIAVYDSSAKFFFYDGDFNYYKHDKLSPNISYPILVPLNLCFFYSIFQQYHYFSKIIFVFYFIFLIIFLYYSLRNFNLNKSYSLLISTFISLHSDVFIHATIAYADLPMTFFYTISTIFLFSYFSTKKNYYLLYSSIFMGFMAWSKNEGYALLFVNSSILLLYNIHQTLNGNVELKSTIINSIKFFLIGFIIFLPWLLFTIFNNLHSAYLYNINSLFDLQSLVSDFIIILRFLIFPQSRYQATFRLFWSIFFIILIVNYKYIFKENIFFLLMLCAIHFLVYIVIYLITPFPLEWQLFFSLNRELLHLTPICGFVIGILLVNNKNLLLDFEENISLSKLVYLLTAIVVFFIIIDILFYEFISNMINSVYSFIFN